MHSGRTRIPDNSTIVSRRLWLIPTVAALCWSGLGLAQTLYRWVDENGEVHYTDSVPATESRQGHTKLNERGLHTETVPPAPTEAELRKIKEEERLKKEEARRMAAQKEEDDRLLNRYRTAEEIELTRDGKLAGVDALIQVKRDLIRATLARRSKLESRKQKALESKKPLPPELVADIEKTDAQIRANYAAIIGMQDQKNGIRQEFDELLAHYLKLKGLAAPAASGAAESKTLGELNTLVSCTDIAQCSRYWDRAMDYLRSHSDPKTEVAGQGLLIGFSEDDKEERSLTLTWTQETAASPVHLFFDLQCKSKQTGSLNCADASADEVRDGFKATVTRD